MASEMRARSNTANTGPTPLNRVEVSVHTERDRFSTSKVSCGTVDQSEEGYESHEVSLGGDVESGPKN